MPSGGDRIREAGGHAKASTVRKLAAAALLAPLLTAAPAAAQYAVYTVPGSLAEQREVARDAVLQEIQDARWSFGPLKVDPRLSIGDLSYQSNVYSTAEDEAVSDLRAKAAAGLRAWLHLGPKTVLSGFAAADYSWWRDQEELRSLGESLGLQLFGLFNRLQFQIDAGQVEEQRNLNSEAEVPVDIRSDRLELSFDIDLYGPWLIFGAIGRGETRYFGDAVSQRLPTLDLAALDSTTEQLSAGVRYSFGDRLAVSLGAELTESDFDNDPGGRSNKSSGPLVRIDYQGNRLSVDLDGVRRDIDFSGGADERRQTTGLVQVGWRFSERLRASVYGSAQLDYSALDSASVFERRLSGVSLQRVFGPRLQVRVFYETGEDEFAGVADDQVTRIDDYESFGLRSELQLTPRVTIEIGAFDTQRDSSDAEFDRSQQTVLSQVRLGGNLLPW